MYMGIADRVASIFATITVTHRRLADALRWLVVLPPGLLQYSKEASTTDRRKTMAENEAALLMLVTGDPTDIPRYYTVVGIPIEIMTKSLVF